MKSAKRSCQRDACPLYALPVELAKHISTCILPVKVFTVDHLVTILKVYPLQYLSLNLCLQDNSDQFRDVLLHAPKILEEVVMEDMDYVTHRKVVDSLFQLQLESLSISVSNLFGFNITSFVDGCCKSKSKWHAIDLQLVDKEEERKMSSHVTRLVRDDKSLLFLNLRPDLLNLQHSGLLYSQNDPFASTLQHLNLSYDDISLEQVNLLAKALASNCSLVTLRLSAINIPREAFAGLGKAIASNTVLVEFSARVLFIEDGTVEGPVCLIEGLAQNQTLENLTINGAKLSAAGGKAVADLLRNSRSIRLIDVNDSYLGEAGTKHIIDALEQNETLEILCVWQCGLTGEQEEHLATKVQSRERQMNISVVLDYESAQMFREGGFVARKLLWRPMRYGQAICNRAQEWRRRGDKINDFVYSKN